MQELSRKSEGRDRILLFCSTHCAPCKDLEKKLKKVNYTCYEKVVVDTEEGKVIMSSINHAYPRLITELPTMFNVTKKILVRGNIPEKFLTEELKKLNGQQ